MKDIKSENSLIEKSIEDISESIVKLKLSDKDKLTISSNSKISELLSSLYQSDPFENINQYVDQRVLPTVSRIVLSSS